MSDIVSVNKNYIQYEESKSLTTSVIETTTVRDATNYSKFALIVNSPNSTTRFLVQWSADNSNWYHVDFYSTVASTNDVDGTTGAQNNGTQNGTVLAKYIRVRLYDDSASGTVKVLLNLLH